MKLSLDTYSIGQTLTLRDLMALLPAAGYDAVEFRSEAGQVHGVELEASKAERRRIRTLLNEAGIEVSVLSTSQRFESPDPKVRQAAIDRSKQFVELADDMGAKGIRVFGNDFPEGSNKPDVIQYVGESIREIGEFAEGTDDVEVLLEMHGQFYYWEYCLEAVKIADNPRVWINYNSDLRDLIDGSVAYTFGKVCDYVHHVHMHRMEQDVFPYVELFTMLKAAGYDRYLSLEEGYRDGGEKKVIELYAAVYRGLMAQVK